MSVVCLIDNSTHENVESLHAYLKRFKIARAKYYEEYFPRKDLLTGEIISFKEYDQYFTQDFKDKNNLKKWLKLNPEKGWEWGITWLKRRKEEKSLVFAPCHVELRSLQCPSTDFYDKTGGYAKACDIVGLKNRFSSKEPVYTPFSTDIEIICDTREQNPIKLPFTTISGKLNYGDYALSPKYDQGIYIERKSISDFAGTLNGRIIERKKKVKDSPYERFVREIERAVKDDAYLVMVVENNINQALSFDYLPQMKWSKVKPSHVFKNLRDILTKYPKNFQVVFADGRIDAAQKMIKIFQMGKMARDIDLQYALERGAL